MSDSDDPAPLAASDALADEARMRRALGLQGPARPAQQGRADGGARGRHRFAQDGSVPVVTLRSDADGGGRLRSRVAELEAALEAERTAHAATRRALGEAQAAQQALQTRLAHDVLAQQDALNAERRRREAAEAALQTAEAAPPRSKRAVKTDPAPRPAAPRKAELRTPKAEEQQPIKWWLPSFRAKQGR